MKHRKCPDYGDSCISGSQFRRPFDREDYNSFDMARVDDTKFVSNQIVGYWDI